ncbi:MAG: Hsp20/alpha crystallin family protein [Thermodesulfobacteriota bacterium]
MAIKDLVSWRPGRKSVPVRRDVESPFAALQRDMNELFDRFFDGFGLEPLDWTHDLGTFRPRLDVSETDTEIRVSAELPGVDEKDVEVSLSDDVLTIKGERREEHEETEKDWYRREQSYGSFHRSIPLPHGIEADKVEASFKRGVLTVTLPKTASARRKKITVAAA